MSSVGLTYLKIISNNLREGDYKSCLHLSCLTGNAHGNTHVMISLHSQIPENYRYLRNFGEQMTSQLSTKSQWPGVLNNESSC